MGMSSKQMVVFVIILLGGQAGSALLQWRKDYISPDERGLIATEHMFLFMALSVCIVLLAWSLRL